MACRAAERQAQRGYPLPGKGAGCPAPSPQIRTRGFPSSGSSVPALFTEPSTGQATPRPANNFAARMVFRYRGQFLASATDSAFEDRQKTPCLLNSAD